MTMLSKVLLFVLRLYQKTLSPDHGWFRSRHPHGFCRFSPTCSEYAVQAIEKYGATRGIVLACSRVFRCHPWSSGGFDPVH